MNYYDESYEKKPEYSFDVILAGKADDDEDGMTLASARGVFVGLAARSDEPDLFLSFLASRSLSFA